MSKSLDNVTPFNVDFTNHPQTQELARTCVEKNVAGVIHCAGYGGPFELTENTTYDTWRDAFSINVDSLFLLTRTLIPSFKQKKYGKIIAISSIQGNLGSYGSSAYVSSKHALNGLVKTIATEYGQYGITANVIAPGYIVSPMGTGNESAEGYRKKVIERTPTRTEGTPKQIAKMVRLLMRPDMKYVNGAVIPLDGGISSSVGVL